MNLSQQLQRIGFSDKEAKVYLTLIQLGSQPASTIAEKSKINRTTCYDIIESLIKKGIVSSNKSEGRTHYQALPPHLLSHYLDREKEEVLKSIENKKKWAEALAPQISSLEYKGTNKPKVVFFEGKKGMRQAYEDTLTSSETIRAFANVESMHKTLPNFFPEYYQRRAIEKKISIRAIMPDNEASKDRASKDASEKRESALVSKEDYDFSPEVNIYDNKLLIVSWQEEMAVLIESEEIAELFKKMYELSWKGAKGE
jgi:sugar-specific transcriptional regulator TrmB